TLVSITILDPDGKAIRTLEGTQTPGINRVWWDLFAEAPRGGSRGLPFGPMNRPTPLVPAGAYTVKLSVEGKDYQTTLTLPTDGRTHADRRAPWPLVTCSRPRRSKRRRFAPSASTSPARCSIAFPRSSANPVHQMKKPAAATSSNG